MAVIMPMTSLAPVCGVAYKEWSGICDALATGRQTILIRKGGIAEGPGGFRPEHEQFWLYPTHLHERQQGLRTQEPPPVSDPSVPTGDVELNALAVVACTAFLDRVETLESLEKWHIWSDETIRKRFYYRTPGLWILGVRVYRRAVPVRVAMTAEHAGCKTWVPLDPPPTVGPVEPALDDAEFSSLMSRLRSTLAPAG